MWAWYFVCRYGCGGDAYFGAMLNSTIHIFMYGYYLFTLMGIPCPWKRFLTQFQLIQFVLCTSSAAYSIVRHTYPVYLACIQIFVTVSLFFLFMNFYMKSYLGGKKGTKIEKEE